MNLTNRILLISGSTGIGAAAAELAVSLGARVFVAALEEASCAALAERLNESAPERAPVCAWLAGDLTLPETAARAVESCLAAFGDLDGLFNVAGISGRRLGDGPVDLCTDEGWDATLASNLDTHFHLTRAALRRMLARETDARGHRGAIVHMSSALAAFPDGERFATHAYAASKGAIDSLTRAMASAYAGLGIRVNAVAPGLTRTPMSARAQSDPDLLKLMQARQPLANGLLDPMDVARAALFLLGPNSAMITGQVLYVDGGWSVCLGRGVDGIDKKAMS